MGLAAGDFCITKARFTLRTNDKAEDADHDPDEVQLSGLTITFKANADPAFLIFSTAPEEVVALGDITATTDWNGVMISEDGSPNVNLVPSNHPEATNHEAFTWTCAVEGPNFPLVKFSFIAPVAGEIALMSAVKVPPAPGKALVEWQAAVTATLESQAAAQVAQVAAENAAIRAESARAQTVTGTVDPADPGILLLTYPAFMLDTTDDNILILPIGDAA